MKISGFSDFRAETQWPCSIDVTRHSEDILAQIHLMSESTLRKEWMGQQVQVLLKKGTLGIFVSPYPDSDPPEWWRDAEVIWRYDQVEPQDLP